MTQAIRSTTLQSLAAGDRRRAAVVPAILVGLVVFAVRKAPAILAPFFWAEDATVFYLQDQIPGGDLLHPYAGQLWIMQRTLAWVLGPVTSVPLSMALYHLVSVVITVLGSAVILQKRAESIFVGLRFQLIGFAGLILLPAVTEVQGNLANVHVWATISVMLCLSFPGPQTRVGRTGEVLWILAVALSGFTSAVLVPVAVWGVLRFRNRWASIRAVLIALSLAIASAVWLTTDRPISAGGGVLERLSTALQTLPGRVGGALIAGEESGPDVWWVLSVALLLLVLVIAITDMKAPCIAWLGSGGVWLLLGVFSMPLTSVGLLLIPFAASRYFTVLLAAGVLTLTRGAAGSTWLRYAAWVGLAAILLGITADFKLDTQPGFTDSEIHKVDMCARSGDPLCVIPARPWSQP